MAVDDAAVITQKNAEHDRRIAKLEADNARLSILVTTLLKRPQLVPSSAALGQLVRLLGVHERDLWDHVFERACLPRYLANRAIDLPLNPEGVLGTVTVTVPLGTTAIVGAAFDCCEGLAVDMAQVSLPVTVTEIGRKAFDGCKSLSGATLQLCLTKIKELSAVARP